MNKIIEKLDIPSRHGQWKCITPRQRFWNKVDKKTINQCWTWTASTNQDGYGHMHFDKKLWRSNRLSYLIHFGDIPNNLLILHTCDNPSCVNPKHLFVGTNQDNMTDMVYKKRKKSKLSNIDILEIRNLYASGNYTQQNIANKYNVSRQHISRIVRGVRRKHVKGKILKNNEVYRGEKRFSSKLTTHEVKEIRLIYKTQKSSFRKLGKMFNVSYKTIDDIVKNKKWRHVI